MDNNNLMKKKKYTYCKQGNNHCLVQRQKTHISLQERWKNKDFPQRFIPGAATGLWWTLVTLTTVG